jgi:hypothetical protein
MESFVGNFDFVSGGDLPGELSDGWEPVMEVACDRCGDETSWPDTVDGRVLCPPCHFYEQRNARYTAASLATSAV